MLKVKVDHTTTYNKVMLMKTIALVVAMDRNYAIGKDNTIPWRVPGELKRFAAITTPGAVIMGRKTWESLPKGALPNRVNYVVTSQSDYAATDATVVDSLQSAIEAASINPAVDAIYIIGGGQIYEQALEADIPNLLYISHLIDVEVDSPDTYFEPGYLTDFEIRDHATIPYTDPETGKQCEYFAKVLVRKGSENQSLLS